MFLLLSPALKQKIADFGHDDDVLSLSSTCQTMNRDLSISVLSPNYAVLHCTMRGVERPVMKEGAWIPVFFEKHCHSVLMRWNVGLHHSMRNFTWRLYVVTKPSDSAVTAPKNTSPPDPLVIQNELGEEGRIVWQSPEYLSHDLSSTDTMEASFRFDANQRYFLWYQLKGGPKGQYAAIINFHVDRLLVWDDSQHTRKQMYTKCMDLIYHKPVAAKDDFSDAPSRWKKVRSFLCYPCNHHFAGSPFLAKLFVTALETIDLQRNQANEPIQTFFESNEDGTIWKELDTARLVALKYLATAYLQLVEHEEGTLGSDWSWEPTILTVTDDDSATTHRVTLPPLLLARMFAWDMVDAGSAAAKKNDTTEKADEPRLITRIPVPSGTKSFRITAEKRRCDLASRLPPAKFLVFAKMPEDYHPVSNESSDGSIAWDSSSIRPNFHLVEHGASNAKGLNFVVDAVPAAKAYFLYVLPGHSRQEFYDFQVHLTVLDDENNSMSEVFTTLLGRLGIPQEQNTCICFLLGLLSAVAETLMQYKGSYALSGSSNRAQSLAALAGLLEAEGIPLDGKDALECLAQLTNEILQHRRKSEM